MLEKNIISVIDPLVSSFWADRIGLSVICFIQSEPLCVFSHAPFHVDLHSRHISTRVYPAPRFASNLRGTRISHKTSLSVEAFALSQKGTFSISLLAASFISPRDNEHL